MVKIIKESDGMVTISLKDYKELKRKSDLFRSDPELVKLMKRLGNKKMKN